MKSPGFFFRHFTGVSLCLILGCAVLTAQQETERKPQVDPEAEKVVRAAAEFYKNLKSVACESDTVMKMEMQGMNMEMTMNTEIAMERPNKLAMVSKGKSMMGAMGGSVVSDGDKVYTYVPMLRKYTVAEAGRSIGEILEQQASASGMMGQGGFGNADLLMAFLKEDPYEAVMEGVQSGSYIGKEKIDEVECHRVKFIQEEIDWEAWFATGKEPKLMKFVPDMSKAFAQMAGKHEDDDEDEDENGNEMAEMFRNMKMEVVVAYKNWQINPELPQRFVFTPPEGAEKVETFFEQPEREAHPLLGQAAPEFEADLLDGKEMKLSEHKDKDIVILDFWATWCGPCIQAMPALMEVAEAYKDKGVVFYAVNQRENRRTINRFIESKKWDLTVALDDDGAIGELYKVKGIPQTVIIGKDGSVQAVHIGFAPGLKQRLEKELDTLIAGGKLVGQEAGSSEAR